MELLDFFQVGWVWKLKYGFDFARYRSDFIVADDVSNKLNLWCCELTFLSFEFDVVIVKSLEDLFE